MNPKHASVLLELEQLQVHYGSVQALAGVSLQIRRGELVTLLGSNGAGKSSCLRAISRLIPASAGRALWHGADLASVPAHRTLKLGIGHCPEGRRLLNRQSVAFNLELGAYLRRDRDGITRDLERCYSLFPRLAERRHQQAGSLSGGEQQMLAIGRAMMSQPKLLLLDEPSLGLAPKLVGEIFAAIRAIAADGLSILLVEQNTRLALKTAGRAYVLVTGEVALSGNAEDLRDDPRIQSAYLGGDPARSNG
jgi:branched-chain amino acid transport system ATP-binding protein